jgi:hypothetical protein
MGRESEKHDSEMLSPREMGDFCSFCHENLELTMIRAEKFREWRVPKIAECL